MSYESSAYVSCPAIQARLNEIFNNADLTQRRYIPPFLSAIISPLNTQGVTLQQRIGGNGRKREVQAVYSPRLCTNSVSASRLDACTAGDKVGELSQTYEVDPDAGSFITKNLELRDLIDTCETDSFYVANTINKMIDAVVRVMGTTTLAEAAVLFGVHADTGSDAAVSVSSQIGNNVSDDIITKLSYLLKISEYSNNEAWVVGGSFDFNRYYSAVGLSCCTDALNFDLAAYNGQYGPMPLFDKGVDTAWGANHVGLLLPNALQLITYNEYVGERGIRVIDTETYKQGTIVDPATGLMFDYSAKFDCGTWTFSLGLAHQLVAAPSDMFYACDELRGTNGFWDFVIAN